MSTAILLAGGWHLAQAQAPGGAGGAGGFTPPTFDTYNTDKTPGTKNAGQQVITQAEYTAAITALIAARGGGAGGAPAAGGAAPAGGGAAPAGGGAAGARGAGAFDPAATYATWDTNADGEVTQAEFDARPRRGGGGGARGGGAPGAGGAGGAAPATPPAQ